MRLLRRNTTEFEYFPPDEPGTDLNEFGEHTGEFEPVYKEPETYRGSFSMPSGNEQQQFYGEEIRYTHTIIMDNPKAAISELGMIRWKGDMYDVVAVRPSLNFLNIAIRKQPAVQEAGGN